MTVESPTKDTPPITEKPLEKSKTKPSNTKLHFRNVGVWTVMQEFRRDSVWVVPGQALIEYGKEIALLIPIIYTFIKECYDLAPLMMMSYLTSLVWSSTEGAVGLYFSSRVLNLIQSAVTTYTINGRDLITAIAGQITFSIINAMLESWRSKAEVTLAVKVRYLFDARVIQANLNLDMPTFEEPQTSTKINQFFGYGGRGGAWQRFKDLFSRLRSFASIASQLFFLFGLLQSQPGGRAFAIVCLAGSSFDIFAYHAVNIWSSVYYTWDSNPHYRRMSSLVELIKGSHHRVEVISDVLVGYIQREWQKARILLGDASDEFPSTLLNMQESTWWAVVKSLVEELPIIFYAFLVYRSPKSFSLASISLMRQASSSITYALYRIFTEKSSFKEILEQIKELYELGHRPNKLVDGELSYPQDNEESKGMEVKFENVSFTYPKATDSVIKDISFTIKRGQTVVVVGVNGSGKSTLLKLFNRLYDINSGTISIDGTPIGSYVAADVRRSMAMLYQTYSHYPLSIHENISMGLPDVDFKASSPDEKGEKSDPIKEAARLGGSLELIESQPKGFDTVLRPNVNSFSNSHTKGSQDFRDKMDEITKRADVSAGQWQRLALSRLFLRASGESIKFVAVDEPSASLDPKMEYELFERLRALSVDQGKTMVYVTHRFGYLTKRADLILVMQKGQLVEQGRHADLLTLNGEYANLYRLQAEAFMPDGAESDQLKN